MECKKSQWEEGDAKQKGTKKKKKVPSSREEVEAT